jgi:precorrin-4 methylase
MRYLENRRLAVLLLFCCGLLLLAALQAQAALKPGTFYVVGTGPAGPEHATLRALEVMQQADFILTDAKTAARFAQYLQGKTILADPWEGMWDYKGKPWREIPSLGKEEVKAFKAARIKRRDDLVAQVKAKLAQGQTVALLDNGDPCLFGPSHWYIEGFDPQQVEIIPGVGAFSAAMAALKKSSLPAYDTRFVLQTSPFFFWGKQRQDDLARELAKYPTTMVFFMGLEEMQPLVAMLQKHYPADLPIAVVYHAGFPDREKVVKGTIADILSKIAAEKEQWLGMIIVGRALEGKPYRSRVEPLAGYDD